MSNFKLDERVKLAIEFALIECTDASLAHGQEKNARRLGMSGAEVDAARRGRSFEVQLSRALTLALAAASFEPTRRMEREGAAKAGIPDAVCQEIERFAEQLASRAKED